MFFCPGEKSGSRKRAVSPSFPLLTVSVFHICQTVKGREKKGRRVNVGDGGAIRMGEGRKGGG